MPKNFCSGTYLVRTKILNSVSVIIPTYNRWPIICSAIDSVLNQTYQKTYCVVVDDASTDNTATLIKEKYGNKIKIISNKQNQGQSASKNIGVEYCNSNFVCFLDSDDILYPCAIESRVSLLNESPNDLKASFGLFNTPDAKSHPMLHKKKRGDKLLLSEYLQNKTWCNNNGFLIEKNFFLNDGMYNIKLRNKEDIELLIRLLHKHPFSYCGEEIGKVRDICKENRARNDYEQIIKQGKLFSEIIALSPGLKDQLSESDIDSFISSDVESFLRALYKSNKYKKFRFHYQRAIREGHIKNKIKFRKRYIVSYIKQFL